MAEGILPDVMSQIQCREKQVALLSALLTKTKDALPPAIFVYGHPSTGKTYTIQKILQHSSVRAAFVNCIECQVQRMLYEEILNQLSGVQPTPTQDYERYAKCDNMNEFVKNLQNIFKEKKEEDKTFYIVLDKAERLRNMDGHILPAFLRLSELSGLNVCTIFITHIIWEKFNFTTGFREPVMIHFPDYTKNEMLEIIANDCPEDYPHNFYKAYVNLLMSVFYMACRDLTELQHLAMLNFPKYVEPIVKGEATLNDAHKLWRNIEPHLKKALKTIFLREVSSSQWESYQQTEQATLTLLSSRAHIELPFYSKFLLIAAYLASYNPAKTDKRFFSKKHDKVRKGKITKKKETSNQLLGPKAFPLDRLMAIFYSIVDTRVAPTANLFSQISSLVTLQLLSRVGHDDQLDVPKYKCTVSLDFIRSVSRTVNFEVVKYLYDFVSC